MQEQRNAPRVRVTWKGQVIVDKRVVDIRVIDVAQSGLGFMSPVAIGVSQALQFRVRVQHASDRSVYSDAFFTAIVVDEMLTAGEVRVGARFERIDAQTLDLIQDWIYSLGQAVRPR